MTETIFRKMFLRSSDIFCPRLFRLNGAKSFSTSPQRNFKLAVAGSSGGIGQPLALLLKLNALVKELNCYDITPVTPGVAVDLSHINTPPKVTGFKGPEQISAALQCADVVVIPAGMPRKPGMSRDDLFKTNASIVRDIAACVAQNAPNAIICIITNPVNSMVPLAAEIMKKAKVFDPRRILGVTTLDVVRAAAFVGELSCVDPRAVNVPVIGGHAGITIIPVLSQSKPAVNLDQAMIKALTKRIQEAGTEVVKAKAGGGSATLSMAFAAARLTGAVLKGLCGEPNVIECAYVKSDVTDSPYFATPLLLGKCGVEKNLGYGKLNAFEKELVAKAIPTLKKNIKAGVDFANKDVTQLPGA